MSRIGRQPIAIPPQVQVEIAQGEIRVQGPKGAMAHQLPNEVDLRREDSQLLVERTSDGPRHRSLHGLTRTIIANMVEGVTKGFTKSLELVGTGYRAQLAGSKLILQLGLSHPAEIDAPEGISFTVDGTTRIHVHGIDKVLVGNVAASIRRLRPPEPYKGKGVLYAGEIVRRKAGKGGRAGKGRGR
ncbi:MAG TPA: 50S ribosomal protein L6 [Dehalococcoidia bacterium]|nr:50S ribosomal protein L6 [Dehalococcoidia bacterium]